MCLAISLLPSLFLVPSFNNKIKDTCIMNLFLNYPLMIRDMGTVTDSAMSVYG